MSTLSRSASLSASVLAVALAALLPASRATASPRTSFMSIDDATVLAFDVADAPARLQARAPVSAMRLSLLGADPIGGAGQAPQATTHCYWVCYPGSGCEYQCRFFPQ